jgi:hypothetical protein
LNFSFKDDVTILLLGVSFIGTRKGIEGCGREVGNAEEEI